MRYAQALLESSKDDELTDPIKPKVRRGLSSEKRARMQEEMDKLAREYKLIKDDQGAEESRSAIHQKLPGALTG
ncbi:MAG: hypothetical protein H6855_00160 [Rhodospirillales bacterium]|nr:hypothetical protein [Rhodospirillales bacterium]